MLYVSVVFHMLGVAFLKFCTLSHSLNVTTPSLKKRFLIHTSVPVSIVLVIIFFQCLLLQINGINVVARKNGRFVNTVNDRIFIVGAHYDTYGKSFGVDDSGSGLTAMLQVARQYSDKGQRRTLYSEMLWPARDCRNEAQSHFKDY